MKKILLFLRHGDSVASNRGGNDRTRTLSHNGITDVRGLGKRMADRKMVIDCVYVSPATRTLQTANYIQDALQLTLDQIIPVEDLYNAEMEKIMELIHGFNNDHNVVLVIGHNPILTEAVSYLSHHHIPNIPPAGLVAFTVNVPRWQYVERGSCVFEWFDFGK